MVVGEEAKPSPDELRTTATRLRYSTRVHWTVEFLGPYHHAAVNPLVGFFIKKKKYELPLNYRGRPNYPLNPNIRYYSP